MSEPIRIFELHGRDPRGWGEQHGEGFRDDVRALYDVRLQLTIGKTDLGSEQNVLALAEAHLPILQRYDAALYDELCGIARGSGLSPAQIVVVNHYTDLRDLRRKDLDALGRQDPGGCSSLFLQQGDARLLGQTWDMHGSAEPFALLLRVPGAPDGGTPSPRLSGAGVPKEESTLLFTITGCLGMTGLTSWGLGLTINNLNSTDATLGAVWPATVRKALRQRDAKAALDVVRGSPIGSGRHYVVADEQRLYALETSGTKKKLVRDGGAEPWFHTNHCVDEEMKTTCRIPDGSTTLARYATLQRMVEQGVPADLMGMFFSFEQVGLKRSPREPHAVATCGALVMDLPGRRAIGCAGIPSPDAPWVVVELV